MELYEASVSVAPVDAEIGVKDEILLSRFFSSQDEAEDWLIERLPETEIAKSGRVDRIAALDPSETTLLEILNTGSESFTRARTRVPVAFFDIQTNRRAVQVEPT
jgi:hypothetical protein